MLERVAQLMRVVGSLLIWLPLAYLLISDFVLGVGRDTAVLIYPLLIGTNFIAGSIFLNRSPLMRNAIAGHLIIGGALVLCWVLQAHYVAAVLVIMSIIHAAIYHRSTRSTITS